MLNKVCLIGNVCGKPEIRSMSNGKEVASFSLATNEYWKDKNTGEKKQNTEWHNIVIFNPGLISLVKNYVKKGSKLYIEGSLKTREWKDKNEAKHKTTEVALQGFGCSLKLLSTKQAAADSSAPPSRQESQQSTEEEFMNDDIPF